VPGGGAGAAPSDLNVRLGLGADARAIILNADDFGMCRAANRAITELLLAGRIDSATLMVPCAWAPDALAFAASHPVDVGVHLVLTSEWTRYRWRPLTGTDTSLVDDAGYCPHDVATVERQARDEDVAAELAAQLDAALAAGVDVSHLDNHMGSVYGLETGRTFLPQVFELAARHGLPFRLPRTTEGMLLPPGDFQGLLDETTSAADALGVVLIDRLWTHPFELAGEGTVEEEDYEDVKQGFLDLLRAVGPGVTEIYLHPMLDDEELADVTDYASAKRGFERRLLADPEVSAVIAEQGLVRVGWRDLRAVQRGER
jgi:predicted glycoside hydrolase/deacetylase ChbG (UPF0249 family)